MIFGCSSKKDSNKLINQKNLLIENLYELYKEKVLENAKLRTENNDLTKKINDLIYQIEYNKRMNEETK